MIAEGSAITETERDVFARVARGEDPWNGVHGVGSRRSSAALGRLQRRGYVEYGYLPSKPDEVGWYLTEAGRVLWETTERARA